MFTKFVRVALCELVQRPFRCYSVHDRSADFFCFNFAEALTIPVNENSLQMFPSKLSAKLSSWQPVTFEEFLVREFFLTQIVLLEVEFAKKIKKMAFSFFLFSLKVCSRLAKF